MSGSEGSPRLRVSVVGLGLMGGSLARALKAGSEPTWIGASSLDARELRRAVEDGVVDRGFDDPAQAASVGNVVVYATPLEVTLRLLERHHAIWEREAVITDVVSVKVPVLERIRTLECADRFVGGHPMAGSEKSGYEPSRADLFHEARVHLVRGEARDEAARLVEALWKELGARPSWIGAAEHDRRMARVSHLPQLLASALATHLGRQGVDPTELGPGGRDMTRLAESCGALWEDLLAALAVEDREALAALDEELATLAGLLEARDVDGLLGYLDRARAWKTGEDDPWS